jgi:hypothetical protein
MQTWYAAINKHHIPRLYTEFIVYSNNSLYFWYQSPYLHENVESLVSKNSISSEMIDQLKKVFSGNLRGFEMEKLKKN